MIRTTPFRKHPHTANKGFTLVEVMVALAVVAVGMGALLEGMGNYARYHSELRNRFWSQNIAWNELSKITVAQEMGKLKSITTKGTEKQFKVDWEWTIEDQKTATDTIVRLDMRVNTKGSKSGTRLTTMVMRGAGFNRNQLNLDE